MKLAVVGLVLVSFIISWLLTCAMRSLAPKIGFVDKPGGRKIHANPKPLGGGVGIFWGLALPMLAGLLWINSSPNAPAAIRSLPGLSVEPAKIDAYWSGARQQTPLALGLLAAALAMHLLGLYDDRKAMGPYSKLIIQLSIIAALVFSFSSKLRILTLLDAHLAIGWWISAVVTILWIGAVANAFNFLDNMDGLSAGVASVCALAFLIAALSIGYSQWFVAAALALLLGAMLGFLWHNFPPAKIFMGDSGSLLIGLILGVLTVRTTYLPPDVRWQNDWYAVFAPVIVLALPLYDLIVVSILRLMRGKSPFVGDTNHFSHRLVARGMSRRTAVLCLYLVAAATSIAAILLPHVSSHFAILVLVQTVLILCMVALLEQHPLPQPPSSAPPIRDESQPRIDPALGQNGAGAMAGKLKINSPASSPPAPARLLLVITQVAFLIALAMVIARSTILESIREPFEAAPGSEPYPLGAGAATSLWLDLLCALPVLLILFRRMIDRSYALRANWSFALLIPLLAWMALSIRWADDKFASLISVCNVIAAFALLWSAYQLVRSWLHLRLVAAVAYGLLLVMTAQGFYYKFVDVPDTQAVFKENKQEFLRQRGWNADDFAARQFEKKVMSGEMMGFSASPNSFAAILVLLLIVAAGLTLQRIADKDPPGWPTAIALAAAPALLLLYYTQSKAALATPLIAALLFLGILLLRPRLATKSKSIFWLGVLFVLFAIAAVLGHGLSHHSLPTASLNFRWRYWIAAWQMFLAHPFHGVGWDNFGLYYLRYRLPIASEEIKDPHNFIIRFFVELGAIGGILLLAWLLCLWWELTRPSIPSSISPLPARKLTKPQDVGALFWIAGLALLGMLINILASIDFQQGLTYAGFEIMKRAMFALALVLGIVAASLRSIENPELDNRPAPWVLYGLLIAVGVFLIHNLIEFSLFEPGPMGLFAILTGAALGLRQPAQPAPNLPARLSPIALATAAFLAWTAVLIFVAVPISLAEAAAHHGDEALRTGRFDAAVTDYISASDHWPMNADYPYRAGRAIFSQAEVYTSHEQANKLPAGWMPAAKTLLDSATAQNPSDIGTYLTRGRLAELAPDVDQLIANFDKALSLNPNSVSIRLEYARALRKFAHNTAAKDQLQLALRYDALLDKEEPKRLSPTQINEIQRQIDALK